MNEQQESSDIEESNIDHVLLETDDHRHLRSKSSQESLLESNNLDGNKGTDSGLKESVSLPNKDVMNMFASVWVKVEVGDDNQDYESGEELNLPFESKKPTTKRKRIHNKILCCELCKYTTNYKNCLELHMMSHSSQKPFACDQCDYATKYPTALHRHVMIRHPNELKNGDREVPVFNCDQCEYKTHFKWNLSAHKRKHKPEKQFKCEHCEYATAYRHNYLKHGKTHKDIPGFQCDKCPFVTKFEGHITRHLAKIHNIVTDKAFKCETCDFSTKTRWRLNIHKQRSKQENPLSCAYCDFASQFMCEFKKHKVTHYNQIYGNGKVLQNVQDRDANPSLLKDNIESYQMEVENTEHDMDYQHDIQDGTSQNKYLLDPNCVDWNSIQVLESSDKERPFQCHMCNYTSRFKASVQRHFQRHHTGSQNRPYKCINCDFSTKTKDQIALHNKRSQSDVKLFCGLCKFTTSFKCQYVMHQKCHYLHKCSKCNYSCKHKYELQKHFTTVHLGNGHKCQYCDYKAARKESLLCHETIHTGNKPFKCTHCNYTSVRRSLLRNHVMRHHSDIVSNVTVVTEQEIESLRTQDVMERIDLCLENEKNVDLNT